MIDELVAFLRARYDAEERTAQAASGVCGCHPPSSRWSFADDENEGRIVTVDDPHPGIRRQLGRRWNRDYSDLFAARHIATWDPARVLADIAMKRRILARHSGEHFCGIGMLGDEVYAWWEGGEERSARRPCAELRDLAGPYADHPDYRDEWRP